MLPPSSLPIKLLPRRLPLLILQLPIRKQTQQPLTLIPLNTNTKTLFLQILSQLNQTTPLTINPHTNTTTTITTIPTTTPIMPQTQTQPTPHTDKRNNKGGKNQSFLLPAKAKQEKKAMEMDSNLLSTPTIQPSKKDWKALTQNRTM